MITLSKLAKLANVSVSTASKAFSLSSEVNEETREHIFKIAKAPLASISSESYEICRLAADSVIKRIGGDYSGKSVTVPAKLKFRKSFEV